MYVYDDNIYDYDDVMYGFRFLRDDDVWKLFTLSMSWYCIVSDSEIYGGLDALTISSERNSIV